MDTIGALSSPTLGTGVLERALGLSSGGVEALGTL